MKNYLMLLILNSICLINSLSGQNLLDGNFADERCDSSKELIGQTNISLPMSVCYLTRWKTIGGVGPRLIENEGDLTLCINFGKDTLLDKTFSLYREYIQSDFELPLEKNIWYKFTAEIKVNEEATVGISDFEVFFGVEDVSRQLSPFQNKGIVPQIKQRDVVTPYNLFDYRIKWRKIERYYKANGGELYLIIGNFKNEQYGFSNISRKVFDKETGNLPNASYLIKGINLTKMQPPKEYVNNIPIEIRVGDKIVLNTIEFEINQSKVKEASISVLRELADLIMSKEAKVHIIGHTDSTGEAIKNLELSKERALSVMNNLVRFGVEKGSITTEGKGEKEPVSDNGSIEGRTKNRRVEIKILEAK